MNTNFNDSNFILNSNIKIQNEIEEIYEKCEDNVNNVNEDDIIILDDDDFIQTTLNILNTPQSIKKLVPNFDSNDTTVNETFSLSLVDGEYSVANTSYYNNLLNLNSNNQQQEQNDILIDLTSCDDFDLDDLFLIHSNNNSQCSPNQQNLVYKNENQNDFKSIKNEFDFKVFNNFDFNNFENCVEEILIDDDDSINELNNNSENNYDANKEINEDFSTCIENNHFEKNTDQSHLNNLNANVPISLPFSAYRNIESSPDVSQSSNKKQLSLKCSECGKTFNKVYNYKRHLIIHGQKESDSNRQFSINSCPICKRQILDNSNFKKHFKLCKTKYLKKNISFHENDFPDQNISTFRAAEIIKKKSIYNCKICNKIFSKKFNYHRHLRMHFLHEVMNHKHDLDLINNLKKTNTTNNPQQLSLSYYLNLNSKFYECDECSRKFNESKQLLVHKTKWHLTEFMCNYCENQNLQTKFKKFDYIKHLNLAHSIKLKFECNYCHKNFRYLSHYAQHKKTHFINTNNSNDQDNWEENSIQIENDKTRKSASQSGSDVSQSSNKKQLSFKCSECGKTFNKVYNYKRHLIIHGQKV